VIDRNEVGIVKARVILPVRPVWGRGRQHARQRKEGHPDARGIELPFVVPDNRTETSRPAVKVHLVKRELEALIEFSITLEGELEAVRIVQAKHFEKQAAFYGRN